MYPRSGRVFYTPFSLNRTDRRFQKLHPRLPTALLLPFGFHLFNYVAKTRTIRENNKKAERVTKK